MPRITSASNGSVVRPTVTNAKVQNNMAAFEAEIKSQGQIGAALGNIGKVYMEKEQEKDTNRLLEAENEYNRRITELKTDIQTNRRLGQASGSADYFNQQATMIKNEVYGNSGIKYRATQEMFNIRTERSTIADVDAIHQFEIGETDKNFVIQLDNSISDSIKTGLQTGDIGDISLAQDNILDRISGMRWRFGDDWVQSKTREAVTQLAKDSSKYKLSLGDVAGAQEILNLTSSYLDDSQVIQITTHINEVQKDIFSDETNRRIRAEKGDNLTYDEYVREYGNLQMPVYVQGGGNIGIEEMIQKASAQKGMIYTLGGDGVTSTDCGKFIQDASNAPTREVDVMYRNKEASGEVFSDRSQLKRGDVVYYKNTSDQKGIAYKQITHAGIYLGDGQIIHAGSSRGVSEAKMDDIGEIAGFSRPFLEGGAVTETWREPTHHETQAGWANYQKQIQIDESTKNRRINGIVKSETDYITSRIDALGDDPDPVVVNDLHRELKNRILATADGDSDIRNPLMNVLGSLTNSHLKAAKENYPLTEKMKLLDEVEFGAAGPYKSEAALYKKFNDDPNIPRAVQEEALKKYREAGNSGYDELSKIAGGNLGWNSTKMAAPENKQIRAQAIRANKMFVADYRGKFGVDPPINEQIEFMQKTMATQSVSSSNTNWFQRATDSSYKVEASDAQLMDAGIAYFVPIEFNQETGRRVRNMYSVAMLTGEVVDMNGDNLTKMIHEAKKGK